MNRMAARFGALWTRAGGRGAEAVYAELVRHYADPARHYHALHHLRRCLRDLDWAREAIEEADAVELALWCHDVIYTPGAGDNERRSAEWFRLQAQARIPALERIAGMILATTHRTRPNDPGACFTADIDLAGLGRERAHFRRNQAQLRAERPDLDDVAYDARERAFLAALLARERIFYTDLFYDKYESRARLNLAWRLKQKVLR
jgi:predicted metal-dependent HD superfamily phosphohydrolase